MSTRERRQDMEGVWLEVWLRSRRDLGLPDVQALHAPVPGPERIYLAADGRLVAAEMTEIVDPAEKRFEPFARRFLVVDVSPRLRSLPGKVIVFGRLPWEIGQRERGTLAQQLADQIESRLPELEPGRPAAILVADRLELDIVLVEGPGVLTWGGQIIRASPMEAVVEAEIEALEVAIVKKINRGQLILFDVDRRILLLQSYLIGLEGTRLNEAIQRIDPRLLGCIDEVVLVTRDGCHWGHGEPT